MGGTKFFGIGVALVICILALLLASSIAWAKGKPDHARKTHTEYGYAVLADRDGDVIKSDSLGQYIDCNQGGEDWVQIVFYDDGALKYIHLFFGKTLHHYPELPGSEGRVLL